MVAAFEIGPVVGSVATGLFGVVAVNVMNNIPATLLFEKAWLGTGIQERLADIHPAAGDIFIDASLYASNFGANLTFIGALAGLMWLRILREPSGSSTSTRLPTVRGFLVYGLLIVPVVTVTTCTVIGLLRTVES